MGIFIAAAFVVCGILLLAKSRNMSGKAGLSALTAAGAVGLILLGGILAWGLLSGRIVPPLW